MSQFRDINIDIVVDGKTERVDGHARTEFVKNYRFDELIPNRYSEVLVVDLMINLRLNKINPRQIIDEIEQLESTVSDAFTKEATQYKHPPLHPLWHKHYFSEHFLIENIQIELQRKGRWSEIFRSSLGAEGSILTKEQIKNLAHETITGTVSKRSDEKRITGEWLIFAKEATGNIYLCMANHDTGDQNIYDKVAYCCKRQFPHLEPFNTNRQRP